MIPRRPIAETSEGYLARAKAVFKLGRKPSRPAAGDRVSLGEFLHQADLENA